MSGEELRHRKVPFLDGPPGIVQLVDRQRRREQDTGLLQQFAQRRSHEFARRRTVDQHPHGELIRLDPEPPDMDVGVPGIDPASWDDVGTGLVEYRCTHVSTLAVVMRAENTPVRWLEHPAGDVRWPINRALRHGSGSPRAGTGVRAPQVALEAIVRRATAGLPLRRSAAVYA